ncbi:protein of unknown function [Candidatus Nitrosocosmicus franklandus]|uniref:Uncharacterized protein n=1 Tax=Candidatus Nitrosocosmicus franklandianus TaxID=1798806 RepID=A0A484IAJ3_9ARCH|nr:protein of unknown function [Candidatus Nitrosocosmicus franklandus]
MFLLEYMWIFLRIINAGVAQPGQRRETVKSTRLRNQDLRHLIS